MSTSHSSSPLSWSLLAAGVAAFFTLGLIQAMYGPALPYFQQRYGVGTGVVGLIASAHFLGSASAPPFTGWALRQVSVRFVSTVSLLVLALGGSVIASAPSWSLAVAGAFLAGLGLGGVSAALNSAYASLGTRAVNIVNAVFGLGSMLAPLLVAVLAKRHLTGWSFLVVALMSAVTLLVGRVWGMPGIQQTRVASATARPGVQFALFAVLITLYVSLEAGFGAWAVRYLQSLEIPGGPLILTGFWGGLTVGRILTGLFGGHFQPVKLVIGATLLTGISAALALHPTLAPAAFILAGVGLGPVFGTVLAWMTRTLPATLVPFLMIASSAGGVLSPILIGVLFARFGAQAVPVTLLSVSLLLTGQALLTQNIVRLHPKAA